MSNVEPEHVDQLVGMGFPPQDAKKALIATHNCGVEVALGYLVDNSNSTDSLDHMLNALPSADRSAGAFLHSQLHPADVTIVCP